ncbi:MAG: single-stranded-DNA-specific exonuclease RecJ [Actinomycetota bacterium]|nr:single-stranded-DNA-specific exonuclease RecJ [Actinomycetota bacterium]
MLARRGHAGVDAAREFLQAAEEHDPDGFRGMAEVAAEVMTAVRDGHRITVYGDFDADGVCATSILVRVIREIGGTCDWFIPDRIADGYGLNPDAIRALADRGTRLVVTVDCGITAVAEVALARELGLRIVVTDHHQPDGTLPDCPFLHPELSGYPFTHLCGTAVAAKLASRLRRDAGLGPEGDEADLDLVALATVADVMPLTGENRRLVREGVKVARRARRPGMAALLNECRVTPGQLSAEDFGFRLAPRINAAGRMYRADAGVELFLSESPERAAEIARELSSANAERRRVEREVLREAEREVAAQGDTGAAIVVAGEGWHPGVVGIVASRLVKEHGRPSVVIALEGETGRGSARSVPGLDLHAAIGDSAAHLLGFGGHAAAAGVQIEAARVDDFRHALTGAVVVRVGVDPVEPDLRFDLVAGGDDLGLPLAEDLEHLAPFGNGNPGVNLLIPGARITDLREMGDGKHCRFTIVSGSHRAAGVCFGRNSFDLEEGDRADVIAELGLNHWNGSVEPRLNVREVVPVPGVEPLAGCDAAEWWTRFEAAFARETPCPRPEECAVDGPDQPGQFRHSVEWTGLPGVRIGELISSGEPLAILTADAIRRWAALGGEAGLGRFNPEGVVGGLWEGSPGQAIEATAEATVLLLDHSTLATMPPGSLDRFAHVVILDPPAGESQLAAVRRGQGMLHTVAGADELEFAGRAASHRSDPTAELRGLYGKIRAAGAIDGGPGMTGDALLETLAGPADRARSPERAALLVRVLEETGLLRTDGVGAGRVLGVVSSVGIELSGSPAFRTHIELHKEQVPFLRRSNRTANSRTG